MSRHWDDADVIEQRIRRGLVVDAFGPDDVDVFEYIRRAKGR